MRECVGYQIINSKPINEREEIVIGYNENAVQKYVCWYCRDNDNYFWGYYTNSLKDAIKKMDGRILKG